VASGGEGEQWGSQLPPLLVVTRCLWVVAELVSSIRAGAGTTELAPIERLPAQERSESTVAASDEASRRTDDVLGTGERLQADR
jgi:hypothetical protein